MGANSKSSIIILRGIDNSQVRFGKWPCVRYDTNLGRVIGSAGRFRDPAAEFPELSGYYLNHFFHTYVLFKLDDRVFFGEQGRAYQIHHGCAAHLKRGPFLSRFQFIVNDRIFLKVVYGPLFKYLIFPPFFFSDLLISGGADDWDFDFFRSAEEEINSTALRSKLV